MFIYVLSINIPKVLTWPFNKIFL